MRTTGLTGLLVVTLLMVAPAGFPSRLVAGTAWAAPAGDGCTTCHRNLDERLSAPVAGMPDDAHAKRGLGCASCHGGNPDRPGIDAHDRRAGFVGAPRPEQVPQLCARCHSSPEFMRRFNPRLPTDQYARYLTSVHGQRLTQGDRSVATCTGCHGVHPVRTATDSQSPVFDANVPATCARCHDDASRMKPYGIPTTQYDDYRQSVHGQGLLLRGNRQAPACNDCHDNHGAVPPGVTSVANVCAQCHGATRDLFIKSPHKTAFDVLGLAECTICHNTHKIAMPTDAMIGSGNGSVCTQCHPAGSAGLAAAAQIRDDLERVKAIIAEAESLLLRASRAGMDVTDAQLDINDATTQLILARAVTHAANPGEIQQVAAVGVTSAEKAKQIGEAALAELAFRRRGLVVTIAIIVFVALTLWLKLRDIERSSRPA